MEVEVVSTLEHYERLIEENNDSVHDSETLQEYMRCWDGPQFYQMLGSCKGKRVMEVGVGTGRVARKVLEKGCRCFTGIDISPRTIRRAENNLKNFSGVELLVGNIEQYQRKEYYDVVYSVLTFMHVENKGRALSNIIASLKTGGHVVLSISQEDDWLEYGSRRVRLHSAPVSFYIDYLKSLGCHEEEPIDLIDERSGTCSKVATLIKAVKQM